MSYRSIKIQLFAAIAIVSAAILSISAGCAAPKTSPSAAATTAVPPLAPGPNDARITYRTARFLEDLHYSQQPLDKGIAAKFFDGYVESLDPRRENFLQSDIDEFAVYRTNLDTLTLGTRGRADLTPAFKVYARFLERITEHTEYVDELLKQDRFRFNTDERIVLDRRHAPYPADLAEAQALWRQRLRYEFLQDRLDREFAPTNGGTILPLPKNADTEISEQLTKHYNWILRSFTNWGSDNVLQVYLNALTHAYDPHTDYLSEQRAQDFSINMGLALFGIGAQLAEDDGYCTIASLVPGGPADKSGQVRERERIIAVAQSNQPPVNVVDMDLPKVVELIRGPKGTQVQLTLEEKENSASRHVVTLARDEIKLEDQEAKAQLIEMTDGHGGTNRIGVVSVPSFYATIDLPGNLGHSNPKFMSMDVAKLISKLEEEKVAGIILDMRNNPGGSLEEAIQFTGLFIKGGPVVLARNSEGQVVMKTITNSAPLYSGPLLVLINRFSASAAEIAAAALQDYGRAVVVGDVSTHGKGTVQNLTPLRPFIWPATPSATNDPGTLKITISKFYRVTGASTQLKGVVPDIVLPDVLNYSTDIGERALDNPLPWDILSPQDIAKVSYERFNLVEPYVANLHSRSEIRTATNRDFDFIRQDIEEFKKAQAENTVTLNEQQALKERKENAARKLARDEAMAKQAARQDKVYELTVENAANPGLPSQLVETNSPANLSEGRLNEIARLNESEHILEDYISLGFNNGLFAEHQ
jgi:carboxyl-terminal processing protease